ncbi:phage/plasmid primase, P4 family [Desulfofarcimen acetoxidans DSM 771]|uniref:Phage/plasmid primase, P4 family n=1 Tax=Desulfofarcimen acetoxidans (strain ATCC 49208 / DSM 771 / KCTC 5769 / VKM B-1644 / 5575) TaxID=485916 RepID=C8VWP5_DESAS|nr:phage/plasmid primase, P4 family [Desulfofarcimen acetoxidans]ACV64409.1 phage/plasmid primase, P4 family [Desulfofarcimen acetoxidans DSM 771]
MNNGKYELILSRLENVQVSGNGYTARCPVESHNDTKNSLSIRTGNDNRILLKCHAGCSIEDIVRALGLTMRDLFPFPNHQNNDRNNASGITLKELATDKYMPINFLTSLGVYQSGRVVKIPYRLEDGSPAPRQRLRTALKAKDGSRWAKGEGSPVPYGLWKLREARDAGQIVLCEGESDAWTLWYHGFPAMGLPGADMTKKLKIAHFQDISRVYVIREPDQGGDTFVNGMTKQFSGWRSWRGELFEVRLSESTGAKDPNDLHKQDPDNFKNVFMEVLSAAKPLEIVNQNLKSEAKHMFANGNNLTDLGNTRRLVTQHGQTIRYCHIWKKWLIWNGKFWEIDNTGAVVRLAKNTVMSIYAEASKESDEGLRKALVDHARKSEAASRIKAMITLAESEEGIPISPDQLDNNRWLLNCLNGTVDLKTGKLLPHRRDDYITKIAPVEYRPDVECPIWHTFLNEIMEDNQNLVSFLQRAAGMCLTGDVSEHVLFVLHGNGRNGKSTLLNIMLDIMNDYSIQAPPDLLMAKHNERHPTELADLFGKRLVVSIESDEGRRMAESLIKQLTGGDKIKARRMREDFWEFWPSHKLWLATNHKPQVRGTDTAIWSRLKLIPFNVSFAGRENKQLPAKLLTEKPGIFKWLVEGCLAWQREGLGVPDEVQAATEIYRTEQDTLGNFLTEHCITNPLVRVPASDIYRAYKAWCENNNEYVLSQKIFGTRLSERGFNKSRGTKTGGYVWYGIGLLNDLNDTERFSYITASRENKSEFIRKIEFNRSVPSVDKENNVNSKNFAWEGDLHKLPI